MMRVESEHPSRKEQSCSSRPIPTTSPTKRSSRTPTSKSPTSTPAKSRRAWRMADAKAIDAGIAAAVEAQEACRKMAPYQRQAVLEHCVKRFRERYDELAMALCIEAGKPIKDSRGEVTRLIDTFKVAAEESVRIDGEVINLEISRARERLSRFLQARADRAVLVHLAVQLSAEPGRAQGRAGARGRLSVRAEAGEPHADRRADHGRGAGRDRSAERRVLDPAGASRRRRPVHDRRALQAAVLHRLARGRLGSEGARRQEEGGARTRRQCGVHRRCRSGRPPRLRRRAHDLRRVLSVRAELHRRAAHPGAGGFLRSLPRRVRRRDEEA